MPKRPRVAHKLAFAAPLLVVATLSQPAAGDAAEMSSLRMQDRARDALVSLAAKNPFANVDKPLPGDARFSGHVAEVLRAGSYTYARVVLSEGRSRWVVTMARGIERGMDVVVTNMGTQRSFQSKRLGRSFDELVFGVVRSQPESGK